MTNAGVENLQLLKLVKIFRATKRTEMKYRKYPNKSKIPTDIWTYKHYDREQEVVLLHIYLRSKQQFNGKKALKNNNFLWKTLKWYRKHQ